MLKDTLTCSQGEPGLEPVTFQTLDDPLYLLSYSLPDVLQFDYCEDNIVYIVHYIVTIVTLQDMQWQIR